MQLIVILFQIIIALGIANVWLLRSGQSTAWRGGSAQNMTEEFAEYGLPAWFMKLVGAMKLTFAALLVIGIWVQGVTVYAALGLVALMLGAVAMHVKIGDPPKKAVPAFAMLAMSAFVAAFAA
jgi:hypothetical protein